MNRNPIALLILILFTALGGAAAPPPVAGNEIVLVDQDGIEHRLARPCSRIISLYPAHTENLASMGATDALIGISTSADYPPEVLDIDRYSYHDNVERLIEADPDCILIRPMIRRVAANLVAKLDSYGIPVISLQPTTPAELYDYWHTLGTISGRDRQAAAMVRDFRGQLEQIRRRVAEIPDWQRRRVYFESIHARMKTFSPASMAMFCLESAGGINAAPDAVPRRNTNIAAYSKERIIAKAAEIDIYLAQVGRMNPITLETIVEEPGFGALEAVRQGRIYLIDEVLVSRPTLRLIHGINHIFQLLYSPGGLPPQETTL